MNILTRKRGFVQSLTRHVPAKLSKLFTFGCEALVGHTVVSLRANARITPHRWLTAKSKAWRLTTNKRMVSAFHALFARYCAVAASDIVAIDFSDFKDNRQVLMFARQTRDGRAYPLYFEVLEYPVTEGSQNLFIVAAIKHFLALTKRIPTLVFDRGFAIPHLIKFLAQNKTPFIIRIKKRKFVTVQKSKKRGAVEELGLTDACITEWDVNLRLIVSNTPMEGDPWYLVTNDTKSKRQTIINRYYHRFEIEEFFRDCKRLLGLEQHQMKSVRSLSILLWFVILGTWFLHTCLAKLSALQQSERLSWCVSGVRYVWEVMRQEAWREWENSVPICAKTRRKTV